MRRRQPLPRLWLMTDPRIGDVVAAVARLPKGAGVVFRHYHLPRDERRALFEQVRRIARKRRLILLAGGAPLRGADGWHGRGRNCLTAPVHSRRELIAARRNGARLVFVSPVFATRSHPQVRPLGRVRFGLLVGEAGGRTVALGGMTARRFRSLGCYGWAAIDAFLTMDPGSSPG